MSSQEEEEKKVQQDSCTKCKKPMKLLNDFSFPVELTCGHEVCIKCIIKELPEEEAELCCQVCDKTQKIKDEGVRKNVRRAREEASEKIPELKCKAHQKDTLMYCGQHDDWICEECFVDHSDHYEKTAKGTSRHVYNMLKKAKKAVAKQKKKLEEKETKIKNLMTASEFMRTELKSMFKEIREANDQALIEKSSVDFLEPYLALIENELAQIPINIPARFTGFDASEIFKTQKQKDAMNDYMKSVLQNIKGYTKIYTSTIDGFNLNTFHEKCKNHTYTIAISRSNFGKILGGYSPMQWRNFSTTNVTGGESFVFFYDDDKIRICTQKPGAQVYSTGNELCRFDVSYCAFRVIDSKSCWARIQNASLYNFPSGTDMNRQGEFLNFSGSGKHDFISEIFEVFGVDL